MNHFSIVPELCIGKIVEVAGNSIRIELDEAINELTRTYKGRVYPVGQFASVIKIPYGQSVLLAYVELLRMRSEIEAEEQRPISPSDHDARIVEASLFGEGRWNSLANEFQLLPGLEQYPLPGQDAYLTTQEELSAIYGSTSSKEERSSVPIGSYVGSGGTPCYVDLDKLFGLHCAVMGSTGAGKSATVSALLHAVLESDIEIRPRITIIDPHGEYKEAFGSHGIVYHAYSPLTVAENDDTDGRRLQLPYWTMTGEEIRDLIIGKTEYEATSENNIVYKALEHARLVNRGVIAESQEWEGKDAQPGFHPETPRPKDGHSQEDVEHFDRDIPEPFSWKEFERHIRLEQMMRIRSNEWAPKSPSRSSSHRSVLDKLSVLRADPRLSFMMKDYDESDEKLSGILHQFVGDLSTGEQSHDIRIIDISGLPNEVAGPLTAAISRLLFQYKVWQTLGERNRDPVLFVCEEAHRYVPNTGLAEYQSAQSSIRRIAREGRKYGLGLMLVSQRPADVERTVLSQCNSWIVLRLTNSVDQEQVARFLPDGLSNLTRLLPSLARQEAIFVGQAATIPAHVRLRTLDKDQLPDSHDVSFTRGWAKTPADLDEISDVTDRWCRR